ncbi:MAG: hypothetical protein ABIZ04_15570 [Opitutus sp.]
MKRHDMNEAGKAWYDREIASGDPDPLRETNYAEQAERIQLMIVAALVIGGAILCLTDYLTTGSILP